MDITTLELIYKAVIGGTVLFALYGIYINISDYRSITKWEKENN